MKMASKSTVMGLLLCAFCSRALQSLGPTTHGDNFQDELVDQADPEFRMVSGGDDCISWNDLEETLQQQFQAGAPDMTTMTEDQQRQMQVAKQGILDNWKMVYEHADSNHDGCIDKKEFKRAGEMEGKPPGFHDEKVDEMGERDYEEEMRREQRMEFDFMDRSGDGKISKTEAYHYVSENMPHADMSPDMLDEMFGEADTNKDGFVTFDEFCNAGQNIEGDGNEMDTAKPMTFFKIAMAKRTALRSAMKKGMLAHKPPLKTMVKLLKL